MIFSEHYDSMMEFHLLFIYLCLNFFPKGVYSHFTMTFFVHITPQMLNNRSILALVEGMQNNLRATIVRLGSCL